MPKFGDKKYWSIVEPASSTYGWRITERQSQRDYRDIILGYPSVEKQPDYTGIDSRYMGELIRFDQRMDALTGGRK